MPEHENKSTGPRTPEGKQRSSHNSVKHGAFANFLLEHESQEDFDKLHAAYTAEYLVEGPTEESLVLNLAQTEWRRRRPVGIEARAVDNAAATGDIECKFMGNFSLYMHRINRDFQSTLKTLKEHQAKRWEENGLYFRVAVHMLDHCQRKNIPWDPSEEEFVFPKAALETEVQSGLGQGRQNHPFLPDHQGNGRALRKRGVHPSQSGLKVPQN